MWYRTWAMPAPMSPPPMTTTSCMGEWVETNRRASTRENILTLKGRWLKIPCPFCLLSKEWRAGYITVCIFSCTNVVSGNFTLRTFECNSRDSGTIFFVSIYIFKLLKNWRSRLIYFNFCSLPIKIKESFHRKPLSITRSWGRFNSTEFYHSCVWQFLFLGSHPSLLCLFYIYFLTLHSSLLLSYHAERGTRARGTIRINASPYRRRRGVDLTASRGGGLLMCEERWI